MYGDSKRDGEDSKRDVDQVTRQMDVTKAITGKSERVLRISMPRQSDKNRYVPYIKLSCILSLSLGPRRAPYCLCSSALGPNAEKN